VRQLAERGLRPQESSAPDLITSAASAPAASSADPSLGAMLAMLHRQHPQLKKPPRRSGLALPGPAFLALLKYLHTLPEGEVSNAPTGEAGVSEHANSDDAARMDVDGIDQTAVGGTTSSVEDRQGVSGSKLGDAYLLILEHGLVRCAPVVAMHICQDMAWPVKLTLHPYSRQLITEREQLAIVFLFVNRRCCNAGMPLQMYSRRL
jgi:hypothetical protein